MEVGQKQWVPYAEDHRCRPNHFSEDRMYYLMHCENQDDQK